MLLRFDELADVPRNVFYGLGPSEVDGKFAVRAREQPLPRSALPRRGDLSRAAYCVRRGRESYEAYIPIQCSCTVRRTYFTVNRSSVQFQMKYSR